MEHSEFRNSLAELRNEMLEERSAMQLKLRDTAEDAVRAVERLEADLSDQIAEVRGGVVDDLSTRLETLQEQSEQTLLGFREHMDNEFEAEGDRRDELYPPPPFLSFFLAFVHLLVSGLRRFVGARRDELKSSMEGQAQDAKEELDFRIKSCEEQVLMRRRDQPPSSSCSTSCANVARARKAAPQTLLVAASLIAAGRAHLHPKRRLK